MTTPIILPPAPLTDAQHDCVEKLEETLMQAKAGKIFTVGIVCCFEQGVATVIGGTDAGAVNLGLDLMKQQILQRVDGERDQRTSRIVRARG